MTVGRLIAVNFLIRVAAAASGQLFVFLIAERLGERVGVGSFVVGLLAASFFITELLDYRLGPQHGRRIALSRSGGRDALVR